MTSNPPYTMYYGIDTPLPETTSLRAGSLTLLYEHGDLRSITIGEHEILSRIYVAVRDPNWGTIPAQITVQEMSVQPNTFLIRYQAAHQQNDIHFVWDGIIEGHADGSLRFSMDGIARSTFRRNRIGFCILHPMTCAGAKCTIEHVEGTITTGVFPVAIAPHQPFMDIRAITHEIVPGVQAKVRLTGDTFEMEDQRNWTDASYKTYCTPLDLPFPVEVAAGTRIQQTVELRLVGQTQAALVIDANNQSECLVSSEGVGRLPQLGLCVASHSQALSDVEIERLRRLNLSHLRVDVHFKRPTWEDDLRRVIAEAQEIGVELDVALHLTENAEAELSVLRQVVNEIKPSIRTWLLFHDSFTSTPGSIVPLARHYLESASLTALFAGGTDGFFTQLNRDRPELDGLDAVVYSLNPQVHAFDNASLVETLPTQGVTLNSARHFCADKPLIISPVTLKPRFNPAATSPKSDSPPGVLPAQVDPRQMSLFGAGWTLGSIKYLAEGGACRVTYYETTGWLGVMETAAGSPLPDQFSSLPGSVFPLYHVLADVGEMAGAEVLPLRVSQPRRVNGLALRNSEKTRILLVNFTAKRQSVRLRGVQGSVRLRLLDEYTAQEALIQPEVYRSHPGEAVTVTNEELNLELAPFAVATIDMTKGV